MKTSLKILHWTPRLLSILTILLVSLFALDAFGPGIPFMKALAGFLIHLIPSFILAAILVLAWKWELLGGMIFLLVGIGLSPWLFSHNYSMNHSVGLSLMILLIITFPFILSGALFIASYYQKKKNSIT